MPEAQVGRCDYGLCALLGTEEWDWHDGTGRLWYYCDDHARVMRDRVARWPWKYGEPERRRCRQRLRDAAVPKGASA